MFQWLKNRKARKAEREAAIKAQQDASVKAHADRVDRLEAEMQSCPCPINAGKNCDEGCVHFVYGHVSVIDGRAYSTGPRCRLWGRK